MTICTYEKRKKNNLKKKSNKKANCNKNNLYF